jgi:hypothetical protein
MSPGEMIAFGCLIVWYCFAADQPLDLSCQDGNDVGSNLTKSLLEEKI